MRLTEHEALILYTIVIGTLDDANAIGGIPAEQRAKIVAQIINRGAPVEKDFSLKELNGVSTTSE